jgi:putative ABC transport system permease protein
MSGPDMLSDFLSDVRYRLRAIFRRADVERELDDELRFHIEHATEKQVRAGVSRDEAARRARLEFGGVENVKEETRDARGVRVLETVLRDLRYAARGLRTHPGFTLAVVATLALGIGANAAMFGVMDRLMFRPPAYLRDPGSVNRVYLGYSFRDAKIQSGAVEFRRYRDLTRESTSLAQTAVIYESKMAIGVGEQAREMQVAVVSASYFDLFDAQPVLGRFFDRSEDSLSSAAPVVVLGNAFWKTRFGGRRDIIGQQLQVGSLNATIVGVAPPGFVGIAETQPSVAFIPVVPFGRAAFPDFDVNYSWQWLNLLVRRKPGISIASAQSDVSRAYIRSWEQERAIDPERLPVSVARPHAAIGPLQESRGPEGGRNPSIVLWICGVAGVVLLIACANVANLLLGRAFGRRREIAVRLALGATRSRLVAQLLTESILLALLAGLAGLVIGEAGQTVLRTLFLPKTATVGVLDDPRTIAFAAIVVLLAGILTALAPALQSRRADLTTSLRSGVREGGHRTSRVRSALLLAQGALSVFLLVGAGLFVRSLHNVVSTKLGFDVDPLLYVSTNLRGTHLEKTDAIRLTSRLVEEARSIRGVDAASRIVTIPLYQMMSRTFTVPGVDSASVSFFHYALQMGDIDFFRTVGTRIVRGRGFDSTDRRESPRVVVVSSAMARSLWPKQNPLGKCIKFADTLPCTSVVGVAEDIKSNDIVGDHSMQYYLAIEQSQPREASLFVRMHGDAAGQAERVRKQLQPLMPGSSYLTVTPMREIVDPTMSSWRMGATMFLVFGSLALILAAIGLYAVIAYDVAQRSHELGLRIALGAHARDVLRMVLGEGLRFGLAGIALGVAIALAAGHWVQPLLYEESARDPLVFATVAAMLVIAATAASAIPALRAVRVDPSIALRSE